MTGPRGIFSATVAANAMICREHFRLTLSIPAFPPTDPGQFVQVWCRSDDPGDRELEWSSGQLPTIDRPDLLGPVANLRRPFSLAGRRDFGDRAEIDLIHRIVGVGTDWLGKLRPGDPVSVLGPLGNRFDHPPNAIMLLVGGGVGIPPMIYLASRLAARRGVAFIGAVTRDLLAVTFTADAPQPSGDPCEPLYNVAEFSRHGIPAVVSTDDGSYGAHGFVTEGLEKYLDRWFIDPDQRRRVIVYTCGPDGMMTRVAAIAAARGIRCQVAVERAMACGMGTCQSCCIKIKKPDPAAVPMPGSPWAWRLACTDGPVFDADQIVRL
jgi:dihydroorotate dehydrogenase electron transfer subunit